MANANQVSAAAHAAVFGEPDEMWGSTPGRQRKCKSCGGWHSLNKPWPHNCRTEERQMQLLPAPRIIPDVVPHVHGGEYISTRSEQRDFMRENGLVEHEDFKETAGAGKQDFDSREYQKELVDDIKRGIEEDPLNRPPPVMIEQANEKASAGEVISTEGMTIHGPSINKD